jgi:hypothetical protein
VTQIEISQRWQRPFAGRLKIIEVLEVTDRAVRFQDIWTHRWGCLNPRWFDPERGSYALPAIRPLDQCEMAAAVLEDMGVAPAQRHIQGCCGGLRADYIDDRMNACGYPAAAGTGP